MKRVTSEEAELDVYANRTQEIRHEGIPAIPEKACLNCHRYSIGFPGCAG